MLIAAAAVHLLPPTPDYFSLQAAILADIQLDDDGPPREELIFPVQPPGDLAFANHINMAAQPPRPQFIVKEPPKFSGGSEEDVVEWVRQYEASAHFNHWTNEDLHNSLEMYIEGAAKKWFLRLADPGQWLDVPEVVAQGNVAAAPASAGWRTLLLARFQQGNYALFKDTQLRSRRQGIDEDAEFYYEDILALCRAVDPAMNENTKLGHLYQGLKPTLLEKVYRKQPATCAEFLAEIKLETVLSQMVHRTHWSESVLNPNPIVAQAFPPVRVAAFQKEVDKDDLLIRMLQRMESSNQDMKSAIEKSANSSSRPGRQQESQYEPQGNRQHWNGQGNRGQRSPWTNRDQSQSSNYRPDSNPRYSGGHGQHNDGQRDSNSNQRQTDVSDSRSPNRLDQRYNAGNQRSFLGNRRNVSFDPTTRPNREDQPAYAADGGQHGPYHQRGFNESDDRFQQRSPFLCYRCDGEGHRARDCNWVPPRINSLQDIGRPDSGPPDIKVNVLRLDNPTAEQDSSHDMGHSPSIPNGAAVLHRASLQPDILVTEDVQLGARTITAVLDTAATNSAITPGVLRDSPFVMQSWNGPAQLKMADGTFGTPLGSARIFVKHPNGSAAGLVAVMQMNGIDLLLGNDFLRQFRRLEINYEAKGNPVTLGPDESITERAVTEVSSDKHCGSSIFESEMISGSTGRMDETVVPIVGKGSEVVLLDGSGTAPLKEGENLLEEIKERKESLKERETTFPLSSLEQIKSDPEETEELQKQDNDDEEWEDCEEQEPKRKSENRTEKEQIDLFYEVLKEMKKMEVKDEEVLQLLKKEREELTKGTSWLPMFKSDRAISHLLDYKLEPEVNQSEESKKKSSRIGLATGFQNKLMFFFIALTLFFFTMVNASQRVLMKETWKNYNQRGHLISETSWTMRTNLDPVNAAFRFSRKKEFSQSERQRLPLDLWILELQQIEQEENENVANWMYSSDFLKKDERAVTVSSEKSNRQASHGQLFDEKTARHSYELWMGLLVLIAILTSGLVYLLREKKIKPNQHREPHWQPRRNSTRQPTRRPRSRFQQNNL